MHLVFNRLARPLLLTAGLVAACWGCGGADATVTLALAAATGAALDDVAALRVIVRERDAEAPEVFGPFLLDRENPSRLEAQVTPDTDFYIDVWGCANVDTCAPSAAIARGCSDVVRLAAGESEALTISLFETRQGGVAPPCPPSWED